jgi:hypothetical protein
MGELVVLSTRRPVASPLDFVDVKAGVGGEVFLTVVDGSGDPTELVFDRHQAAEFRDQFEAAMAVAEELARAEDTRG